MSMISEQVKYLREFGCFGTVKQTMSEAADTIESLSAKLEAANGGGWIPCSERLPEENQNVIACFVHGTVTELAFYNGKFNGVYSYDKKVIVAWQPLPEAYHGEMD